MRYVTADIHGRYDQYRFLLQTIGLRPADTLYVLGDVVDRGPDGVAILRDMMRRPNVVPILGNHEFIMAYCLDFLTREITDESLAALDSEKLAALASWFRNGGEPTLKAFRALSAAERQDVRDYLDEFRLFEEVRAGGEDYVLVHAGLENFSPDRPLEDYRPDELIVGRGDFDRPYWPDKYVVCGHTPTQLIPGNPAPGRVYRAGRRLFIDCGCTFGGPLAAVCLDTGDVFYTRE